MRPNHYRVLSMPRIRLKPEIASNASAADRSRLHFASEALAKRALEIDGRSSTSIGEIEASCQAMQRRRERRAQQLRVVFVDYLKQVRASDRYKGQRVYEIGEITAGLRDIAKRSAICVVLAVQLNRGVESREDKRPTLADLRESGDIENDADVVLMVYRESYYLRRDLRSAIGDKAEELSLRLERCDNDLEIVVNRNGDGEATVRAFCDIGRSAVRPAYRPPGLPGSRSMKGRRPWHKRYHEDALNGYMVLTPKERGIYTTCLDLIYSRGATERATALGD
jgi:hypothetical protein